MKLFSLLHHNKNHRNRLWSELFKALDNFIIWNFFNLAVHRDLEKPEAFIIIQT